MKKLDRNWKIYFSTDDRKEINKWMRFITDVIIIKILENSGDSEKEK